MLFQRSKLKNSDELYEVPRTVEQETVRRWRDMATARSGENKVVIDQIEDEMAYASPSQAPSWPTQLSFAEEPHDFPNEAEETLLREPFEEEEEFDEAGELPTIAHQPAPREPQQTLASDLSLAIEDDLKRRFGSNIKSALGPGTVIEGTFRFDSPVCIDGTLTGEIYSSSALIVGSEASVSGTIRVGSLIILGMVNGTIEAEELVEIRNGGMLEADIRTRRIAVEDGGWYNGRCIMTE